MMEFVNGKDDIPYMKWKITAMFQTTNQQSYDFLWHGKSEQMQGTWGSWLCGY